MPLHRIFHHPDAFSPADKQLLADRITAIYTGHGLPAFYVVVLFVPIEKDSFFIGGQPNDKFVRIVVQHLARKFPDPDVTKNFLDAYEQVLVPFIKEKGFDWEVHIEEVARETWRENGLVPPPPNSAAEKEWSRLNKPVPYDE